MGPIGPSRLNGEGLILTLRCLSNGYSSPSHKLSVSFLPRFCLDKRSSSVFFSIFSLHKSMKADCLNSFIQKETQPKNRHIVKGATIHSYCTVSPFLWHWPCFWEGRRRLTSSLSRWSTCRTSPWWMLLFPSKRRKQHQKHIPRQNVFLVLG